MAMYDKEIATNAEWVKNDRVTKESTTASSGQQHNSTDFAASGFETSVSRRTSFAGEGHHF
jgi:hypothetical protein